MKFERNIRKKLRFSKKNCIFSDIFFNKPLTDGESCAIIVLVKRESVTFYKLNNFVWYIPTGFSVGENEIRNGNQTFSSKIGKEDEKEKNKKEKKLNSRKAK